VLAELSHAAHVNAYVADHIVASSLDHRLNGKLPDVHIPLTMLKAVAAEESSWTSNCVSGDGLDAYGTMQLEPSTADQANTKFHTAFDRANASQNITLGNQWLEYLTVYFGITYFHNSFNLKNTKLRDAVLAAYNVGISFVDRGGKIQIGPTGRNYVNTVVGLMQPWQPCQKSWGR
jgi:soluble lytic murein transglycosylase-like protein